MRQPNSAASNSDDLWIEAGHNEDDTVDISLNQTCKCLDTQDARDIHYEDDRGMFGSDASFSKSQSMAVRNLKDGVLFRSASSCDNQNNHDPYCDGLRMYAD